MQNNLRGELIAEFFGTALLVFFGDAIVATAILYGAYQGQWQPSILWGLGVTMCVYAVGAVSGAHLNPAVTLALAIYRKFPWGKVLPYMVAQVVGAFIAAAVLQAIIQPLLAAKGHTATTARIFVTAPGAGFPNFNAFLMEAAMTATLVLVILAISDERNAGAPSGGMGAIVVGLVVALVIGIGGPWTMAAVNPARDIGPRIWMALTGWGSLAFPGPGGYFWVPILGPLVGGGLLAGLLYDGLVRRFIPMPGGVK